MSGAGGSPVDPAGGIQSAGDGSEGGAKGGSMPRTPKKQNGGGGGVPGEEGLGDGQDQSAIPPRSASTQQEDVPPSSSKKVKKKVVKKKSQVAAEEGGVDDAHFSSTKANMGSMNVVHAAGGGSGKAKGGGRAAEEESSAATPRAAKSRATTGNSNNDETVVRRLSSGGQPGTEGAGVFPHGEGGVEKKIVPVGGPQGRARGGALSPLPAKPPLLLSPQASLVPASTDSSQKGGDKGRNQAEGGKKKMSLFGAARLVVSRLASAGSGSVSVAPDGGSGVGSVQRTSSEMLNVGLLQTPRPSGTGSSMNLGEGGAEESQSPSESKTAKKRWKKAGQVLGTISSTSGLGSGVMSRMSKQQSLAIMQGNMARKIGEHEMKKKMMEMTEEQAQRMVAAHGVERKIKAIVDHFDEETRTKKKKGFENLFLSIDKDGGGTVNVAGELGETLIRLGINVQVQVMHEAIAKVCIKRGRQPDDYYGTGVSIKIPVFNELEVDEFVEVMFLLTQVEETDTDKIVKSRTIFSTIDLDRDGKITLDEFCRMLDSRNVAYDVNQLGPEFDVIAQDSDGELDFKIFLDLQGITGTNADYVSAELEGRRQVLREALTTFMTFDVDGGGTIDITEIGAVMRAMGRRVTEEELEGMMEVADVSGKGEIDFEQFCLHILNMKEWDFYALIDAHKISPVVMRNITTGRKQFLSVEELAPNAWERSNMTPEDRLSHDLLKRQEELAGKVARMQDFRWEDFGQHGLLAASHPALDPSHQAYNNQFAKNARSRPFTLTAHKDNVIVTMARFFPQGDRLAMTCSDGALRIFDLTRPRSKQICNVIAHDHHALCLCLSPDGSRAVTGGADWAVSMWTTMELDLISSQFMHNGYVRYIDWSSDGSMIASCGSDMTVCLWNGNEFGPMVEPALGHTSWVRWCLFTKDCKRLLTGSDDQTVMVWEVPSAHVLQTLRAHSHTVAGGCVLANNRLYTAGFDENVLLWTQDTGLLGYMKVFVVEAFDLRRGDGLTGSMSNQRFVTLELGKGQKEQTSNKKGTAPHWFEEFNLSVWDLDESVVVQVFDWDKDENHRFLGEVRIPLEDLAYAEEGVTDKEFDLVDQEEDNNKPSVSLRFTFREVQCIGEVTVLVERAKGLPRMDTFGLSDPFCAVSVGKSERHKTKVVKRNLNPEWNEEFVYNVEDGARELKIVLYDWSVTKEEDFIGQVVFTVEKLQQEPFLDDWFKLKSIDGDSDVKGEVKLTIKFLSEAERDKGLSSLRFRRNPTTWPASARADFNYYAPIGQVVLLGRTILRGKCRFCGKHRNNHSTNLRCDLGKGNYVHCVDVSTDGSLIAWGTGDGRIRVAYVGTAEQIACWTAHAGPVMGLQWAKGDLRLLSYGADHRGVDYSDYVRGSYIPRGEGVRTSLTHVVEIWYVGSMVKAVSLKTSGRAKKNDMEDNEEEDREDSDGSGKLKRDEIEDEEDEDEEEAEDEDGGPDAKAKEKKKARQALGEGSKLRRNPRKKMEGKVGYTPVYYDPPKKQDGTPARSCLKGRGAKRPNKMNFVWGSIPEQDNWFYYPPEYPSEEEEEPEPEKKPRRGRGKGRNDD